MKRSSKIVTGILIVLSVAVGFIIGILVDYPKPEEPELAGTIGRLGNYRNVKVTENDIRLRSDLMNDGVMLKSYTHYYAFYYTESAKTYYNISQALDAAVKYDEFSNRFSSEIGELEVYKKNLENARADIMVVLSVLQNLSKANEGGLGNMMNNANVAIAKLKHRDAALINFIEAVSGYLGENDPDNFPELKKAHDLLSINMVTMAAATNDKPVLNYFDNKEMFCSEAVYTELTQSEQTFVFEQLKTDFENLNLEVGNFGAFENLLTEIQSAVTENLNIHALYSENTNGIPNLQTHQLTATENTSGFITEAFENLKTEMHEAAISPY